MKDKKSNLLLFLGGIFITNAILAELIGVKIFSAEETLGISPANIKLVGDYVLDFNLTAGVILWPVVFITTDIINEYYGKEGVKKVSYLTISLIAYTFIAIYIITSLSPAQFWLDVNSTDAEGNPFNIDYAFDTVFTQGMGIIIASIIAFLVGQLLDVYVFHKLRKLTGEKMIWLRATGSTLISQLIDSFLVLFIAFYILGNWSVEQTISVGIINYIYKFLIAVAITPLLYLAHFLIDRYLGKEQAHKMMGEAARDQAFL